MDRTYGTMRVAITRNLCSFLLFRRKKEKDLRQSKVILHVTVRVPMYVDQ